MPRVVSPTCTYVQGDESEKPDRGLSFLGVHGPWRGALCEGLFPRSFLNAEVADNITKWHKAVKIFWKSSNYGKFIRPKVNFTSEW